MKYVVGIATGMVTGFILGAAAVTGLQAKTNRPVYLISEVTVSNPQAYGKYFAPKVQATIESAGGKIIALGGRGGAGSGGLTGLQGNTPQRVALQEWPDMAALKKWWDSAAYKEARAIGDKYATFRIFAVESGSPAASEGRATRH